MKFQLEIVTRGVEYERYVRAYFSDAFNREIIRAIDLKERAMIERVQLQDGCERMNVRVVPRIGLPAPIEKLLRGHEIAYHEISVFDPVRRALRFEIESLAGEVVQVRGEARFVEDARGICLRIDADAKIRMFGLGGMLERFLVNEVTTRYRKVETVMQSFLDRGLDAA